jgi:hypothetical protein
MSLEIYSVVSRLFDYSLRNNSPSLQFADMELRVFREDAKSLHMDVQFKNVAYNFIFQNNGWLSIKENAGGKQTERFSMGFYRDDHNFSYTGDGEFCLEICDRLMSIIKTNYNLK